MAERVCILFVDTSPFFGGAARSLLDLVGALDHHRFRPVLCAASSEVLAAARAAAVESFDVRFPAPTRSLLPWRALPAMAGLVAARAELWKVADRTGAGIVHSNSTWAHLAAGDLAGLPSIWHCRDMVGLAPLVGRLADTARLAVATSHAVAGHLAAEGVPQEAIRVVHNGVAVRGLPGGEGREAVRAGLRGEWDMPLDAPLLAWVGELAPWKRAEDFLRALAELRKDLPEARGVLLGAALAAGHQGREAQLIGLAEELRLGEAVRFAGWRADVPRCLVAADLLVLTSEREPFGRVLVEAMSAGLPVLARAGGGVAEVLGRQAGLLLLDPSPQDYAEAARKIIENREAAARMGTAGRRRARDLFSPEVAAERFAALYAELLA